MIPLREREAAEMLVPERRQRFVPGWEGSVGPRHIGAD